MRDMTLSRRVFCICREKVCRPKCQMIKEQSGCVVHLPPLCTFNHHSAPVYYNATPLAFWVYFCFFCCLAAAFTIQPNHRTCKLTTVVGSITSLDKIYKLQQLVAQLFQCRFSDVARITPCKMSQANLSHLDVHPLQCYYARPKQT